MSLLAQLLVNGLIAGSIYALVACGFSLIYTTNRFMHFAHGTSVAVSAYMIFQFFTISHIPFYIACLLTLIVSAILGVLIYRFIYIPLQKKNASNIILLVASLGVLILFENLLQIFFGADVKSIGYVKIAKGVSILGAIITPLQIIIIIISVVLLILLFLFMKHTKLGRHMRAVADNRELASIVGINERNIAYYSFIIASALAGIAGILIGLEQNVEPTMGTNLMIKGFTGAIIGGVTSVPASVLGSYLLGVVENLGVWYLPSGYKDAIAFTLLFIFLLIKPKGLFGINKGVKNV